MGGNALLVVAALAFAWSMGVHYTGACMGMPYATNSIGLRPALRLMAALTLVGAAFLSHKMLAHVGTGLIRGPLGTGPAIIVIGVAFLLTTIFTQARIPTSTIQVLVFALTGAALALGLRVEWRPILHLAVLWVAAPVVACGLGLLFTRLFDLMPSFAGSGAVGAIGQALVLVVLSAVGFGYFTSMNQALIGAMLGTSMARGRQTVDLKVIVGILRGWVIGPCAGLVLAYAITRAYRLL